MIDEHNSETPIILPLRTVFLLKSRDCHVSSNGELALFVLMNMQDPTKVSRTRARQREHPTTENCTTERRLATFP